MFDFGFGAIAALSGFIRLFKETFFIDPIATLILAILLFFSGIYFLALVFKGDVTAH